MKNLRKILMGIIFLALLPVNASAIIIDIDTAFSNYDPAEIANFGTVEITQAAVDQVKFEVKLNTAVLGTNADLQLLYFNTTSDVSPLSLVSSSVGIPPTTLSYSFDNITDTLYKADGDGWYDGVLNFGDGTPYYNNVEFVLSATGLTVADFLAQCLDPKKGLYTIALHVQSTSFMNYTSEFLGGNPSEVPEPATMLLFGTGLAGLAGVARRKRS